MADHTSSATCHYLPGLSLSTTNLYCMVTETCGCGQLASDCYMTARPPVTVLNSHSRCCCCSQYSGFQQSAEKCTICGHLIMDMVCTLSAIPLKLSTVNWPLPSNRQHLSSGACLEDKREDNQNCSVLCCVQQLCTTTHTHTDTHTHT